MVNLDDCGRSKRRQLRAVWQEAVESCGNDRMETRRVLTRLIEYTVSRDVSEGQRMKGNIALAKRSENTADCIYATLPPRCRW
jgi:hypothetical protein